MQTIGYRSIVNNAAKDENWNHNIMCDVTLLYLFVVVIKFPCKLSFTLYSGASNTLDTLISYILYENTCIVSVQKKKYLQYSHQHRNKMKKTLTVSIFLLQVKCRNSVSSSEVWKMKKCFSCRETEELTGS